MNFSESIQEKSAESELADCVLFFGVGFMRRLSKEKCKNAVFSPLSIQNLLHMVLLGASDITQKEIIEVLGHERRVSDPASADNRFIKIETPHETTRNVLRLLEATNRPNGVIEFAIANKILFNKSRFTPDRAYGSDVSQFYAAGLEGFDESTKTTLHERVNRWVESATRQQIKNLATPEDFASNELMMVLLNATYFKGQWLKIFKKQETRDRKFFCVGQRDDDAKLVPFMHMDNGSFPYAEGEIGKVRCQVLELPFSLNDGQDLGMLFILPRTLGGLNELVHGTRKKTDSMERMVSAVSTDVLMWNLTKTIESMKKCRVKVRVPKFSFEASYDAVGVLQAMGLRTVFGDQANLSRITGNASLKLNLDKVIHKAKVTIDEEGAEAAAATMATMCRVTSAMREPEIPVFQADRPFMFIIRHKPTGMPLFMGTVTEL